VKEYGLIAEKLAKELFVAVFNFNGVPACKSTCRGNHCKEAYIWVKIGKDRYAAIQLSIDKSILGSKGVEAIHEDIVPMWIDGDELEIAFTQKDGKKMVQKTMSLIKKIIKVFSIKEFKEPDLAL